MREEIVDGIARILWGSAWADHVEEQRCQSLSGCEITTVMPPIPDLARERAKTIAAEYERRNGCSLDTLLERASEADGYVRGFMVTDDYAARFGECLAFMAMGAGVSWFDDHARFPIEVLHDAGAVGDLMCHAADHCRECAEVRPKRALRVCEALAEMVRERVYVPPGTNGPHDAELGRAVREFLAEHRFVIW